MVFSFFVRWIDLRLKLFFFSFTQIIRDLFSCYSNLNEMQIWYQGNQTSFSPSNLTPGCWYQSRVFNALLKPEQDTIPWSNSSKTIQFLVAGRYHNPGSGTLQQVHNFLATIFVFKQFNFEQFQFSRTELLFFLLNERHRYKTLLTVKQVIL